jgi:hypothetical protein
VLLEYAAQKGVSSAGIPLLLLALHVMNKTLLDDCCAQSLVAPGASG